MAMHVIIAGRLYQLVPTDIHPLGAGGGEGIMSLLANGPVCNDAEDQNDYYARWWEMLLDASPKAPELGRIGAIDLGRARQEAEKAKENKAPCLAHSGVILAFLDTIERQKRELDEAESSKPVDLRTAGWIRSIDLTIVRAEAEKAKNSGAPCLVSSDVMLALLDALTQP